MALAALIAVHPLLVYYAQEARGYAAVALACAVGFGCFLDALAGKRALWWALASALALGCHYFAIFPVAIEAAILLARRGRAVLPALGVVALAGVALLPLLARQIGGDHTDNVTGGTGLAERVKGAATSWLVGERGAAIDNLEWLVGALLLAGVGLVVIHRTRAAVLPAVVGGGGAVLIGLAAVGGADYLNNRNTVPVLAIALAVPALGFAAGRAGAALGAAACLALAAATIGALIDPAHAREDWRATARDLGAAPAVIVAPPYADVPLRWYRPALQPSPPQGVEVRELAVVLSDPDRNPLPPGALDAAPVPGFTPAGIAAARPHADRPLPRADTAAGPTGGGQRVGPREAGRGAGRGRRDAADAAIGRLLRRRRLLLRDAGQRRVLVGQVRRRAERLVRDLGGRVVRGRALVGDLRFVRRDVGHARAPTRSSGGAPQACSTSGTSMEPSSCWPFSSSAIRCRHVTAVPFSVATWRGPPDRPPPTR